MSHKGRGYLVIAQNTKTTNYIQQAYALALSINNTQSEVNNLSICVKDKKQVPKKYRYAFDQIIEIPWGDHSENMEWKVGNKWKYYYMTPYYETVMLDTDMIFTQDISHWWDHLKEKDVWATTNVKTFRGENVTSDAYRETFTNNNLPNIYTAFLYFKQSELAAELFRMTQIIFFNWERFYWEFLDHSRPKFLSADVAYALAIKLLGIEHVCSEKTIDVPTFVHMKSHIQNVPERYITEKWTRHFSSYFNERGGLRIANYDQPYPFHYHIKEWLNNDTIKKLEKVYERKSRHNNNK